MRLDERDRKAMVASHMTSYLVFFYAGTEKPVKSSNFLKVSEVWVPGKMLQVGRTRGTGAIRNCQSAAGLGRGGGSLAGAR